MTKKQFSKWLAKQAKLNTLQELYAITLYGNHGLEAVKAWIDGVEYFDPDIKETVVFLMDKPTPPS